MAYFYVYILKCNDDSFYVGHTDNIEKRISEHKLGKYAGYTSTRLPIKVLFVQTMATRAEAIFAEFQIKKWSRKKKEALINKEWDKLSKLARKKFK